MRYDIALNAPLGQVADQARSLQQAGLAGAFTFEGQSDPFFPLAEAATASTLDLYSNVAIAFPRSPMQLAVQSWDLQRVSNGRFHLGLGTQVKPHIEKRFSAEWGKPVAHMRELIQATKAVFATFQDDVRLDHQGDYYTLTLITPMFNPGPLEVGPPPIWVGALGPKMTEMVAEVADGILIHPFNSEKFVREHTIPHVEAGLATSGRTRDDFSFIIDVVVGLHTTDEEEEDARQKARFNLAFYASTPAYKVTLDAHGCGDLQPELNQLSKQGRWEDMAAAFPDDLLEEIAVIGRPAEVAAEIERRYGDIAARIGLSLHGNRSPEALAELTSA